MSNLIANFTRILIENEVIDAEDKEIYDYGLKQGMIIVLNAITTIMIGSLFGMLSETIVFSIAYIPLRSYVGGYHAKTQLRCYLLSVLLIICVLFAIENILWTSSIVLGLTFISGIIIFILAPMEDSNKPLDSIEKKVFRVRTRIIFLKERFRKNHRKLLRI